MQHLHYMLHWQKKVISLKKNFLNLRKIDHMLQGHPDMKHTPGVDMSTGSLGQGISAAWRYGLAGKIDNADYRCIFHSW